MDKPTEYTLTWTVTDDMTAKRIGGAGAKILFCGGMIGTISEVKDSTFLVEVAKGVVVEVAKGAVERPLPDKAEPEKK